MFTPLLDKIAEPPPPEGTSVKEWDKILEKGPTPGGTMTKKTAAPLATIRKLAAQEQEKRAFELLTQTPLSSGEDSIASLKMAAVADPELFAMAMKLAGDEVHALEDYEAWGGTYKHAFGQQMFDTKQMAGSPAVSGGMSSRAQTPMPQMQQSPVSVTTTSIGQAPNASGGASAPAPTSPTSTPSAPTG